MSRHVELIFDAPDVENTIQLNEYQSSFPKDFATTEDKLVLYGGGQNYQLKIQVNESLYRLELDPKIANADMTNITLYILNSFLLIWFERESYGVRLPYTSIFLHAITAQNSLMLQIESNDLMKSIVKQSTEFEPTVDFYITIPETKVESEKNPLFIGQNSTLEMLYNSMLACSDQHYESDPEEEDLCSNAVQEPTFPDLINDEEVLFRNYGDADDIDPENQLIGDNDPLGMDIDVGYSSIAGSIRKREEEASNADVKSRRIE